MTITTATNDSISDLTGTAYAEAIYGNNGDTGGVPGYDTGDPASDNVYGYITWGDDPPEPLDSGEVDFNFQALPGGGTNGVLWDVTGGSAGQLQYSNAAYGTLVSVTLRAAVTLAGCKVSMNGVVVKFYKGGVLIESATLNSGQNPVADALASSDPVAIEQVTVVTPANTDNDKVVVTGTVRLQTLAEIAPAPTDLFGQIYLQANDPPTA